MFSLGCAEIQLDVPLFAELFGYGMFQGRRNIGVHDPIFCRAYSFNDGIRRAMIVYTDTCTTDDLYAREMRAEISSRFHIGPECIAFVATHTHSAPPLGAHCTVGFGEPNPEFQSTWKRAVMKAAAEAIRNEEEITCMETGTAPLSRKLGSNRVEPEKNAADETIRWIRFLRRNSSCKLLLHNHGIHGISMNLPFHKLVSADWMGAANRMIKDRGLADMPLFLLGPCGDVNTSISCHSLGNDTAADRIAADYMVDLEKSIEAGGEKSADFSIRGILKSVNFPVVERTPEELLRDAGSFRRVGAEWHAVMLEEMSIELKRKECFTAMHDFQVIRLGELSFFFIPGEYFVEDGADLMSRSVSKHCFAATVSNGNGAYFPSETDMKRYPGIENKKNCSNNCAFGFYEIYGYPFLHQFKYQDNIAGFTAEQLLNMEKAL